MPLSDGRIIDMLKERFGNARGRLKPSEIEARLNFVLGLVKEGRWATNDQGKVCCGNPDCGRSDMLSIRIIDPDTLNLWCRACGKGTTGNKMGRPQIADPTAHALWMRTRRRLRSHQPATKLQGASETVE